jgi:hypothetical protein
MAELALAAEKQQWEKVEVSPLEADFSSDCGASRAVRLGLGQWTLDLKPSSHAGFGHAMPNPPLFFRPLPFAS